MGIAQFFGTRCCRTFHDLNGAIKTVTSENPAKPTEIDRVGSAWLIRKFIDPKAKFIFNNKASAYPKAVSFDMLDAEFSHQGEDCTFETLTKCFAIRDKVVRKIGEMIHDADLDDNRFQRVEAIGIDRVLKGWAKAGMSDNDLLRNCFTVFEGLYRHLQGSR